MRINEKLGVPEGINQQASIIYNKIMDKFDSLNADKDFDLPKESDFDDGEMSIKIGNYDISIKELELEDVPFILMFYWEESLDKAELVGASYGNKVEYKSEGDNIKISQKVKSSFFTIRVAIGKSVDKSSFFKRIAEQIKPNLIAHELMHLYDVYKRKENSIESSAEYSSYQKSGFPKILSEFLHLLYYTTAVENTVRPTELYQTLLDNKITKSEFLEFVNNTDMIKKLTTAQNFSLEDFKIQLSKDESVVKMVEHVINKGYKSVGSVADDALNLLMINIVSGAIETSNIILKSFMYQAGESVDPHKAIFSILSGGDIEEIEKANELANKKFNQIISKYKKYEKKPQKYFEYLEKMLNFVGDKTKRKLYKLYDMVKDTKTNSIVNWDLHTKISSKKNEKLVWTLDFKSFNKK